MAADAPEGLDGPQPPVAVFWDLHRAGPRASGAALEGFARAIAGCAAEYGAVGGFRAYRDLRLVSAEARAGLEAAGVTVVDEPEPPSKLLVDVMMFAMDEQPPAALVVVSAEEGLANGLNKLSQRGYRVVLIRPPRAALSAALQGTAEAVLEWREVTGEEDDGAGGEEEDAGATPAAGAADAEGAASAPPGVPPGAPAAAAEEGGGFPPARGRKSSGADAPGGGPYAEGSEGRLRGALRDPRSEGLPEAPKGIPFFSGDGVTISQLVEGGVSLEGVLNQLLQDQESKGGHGISDIPPDVVPVSSFYSYFNRTAPAARVDLQAAARAGVVELGGQRPKEWVRLCRGAIKPSPSLRPRKGPIPFFSGDASQIDWLLNHDVTLESVLSKLRDEGHGRIDLPQNAIPLSSVYTYFNKNFPLVRVDLQAAEREKVAELGGKRPMEWVRLYKYSDSLTTPIGLVEDILRESPECQLFAEELNKELAKAGLHSSHYGFPRFKDFLMALPRDIFSIERCGPNGERLKMSLVEGRISPSVVDRVQAILKRAPSGGMYAEDLQKELARHGIYPAQFGHTRLKDFLAALPQAKVVLERGSTGDRIRVMAKAQQKNSYSASQDNIFVGSAESLQLMKDNNVTLHTILDTVAVTKDRSVGIHTLYQYISRKYHVKLDLDAAVRAKIVETGGQYPDKWVRPFRPSKPVEQSGSGAPLSVQNIWRNMGPQAYAPAQYRAPPQVGAVPAMEMDMGLHADLGGLSIGTAQPLEMEAPAPAARSGPGYSSMPYNAENPEQLQGEEAIDSTAMMDAIDQRLMDLIK